MAEKFNALKNIWLTNHTEEQNSLVLLLVDSHKKYIESLTNGQTMDDYLKNFNADYKQRISTEIRILVQKEKMVRITIDAIEKYVFGKIIIIPIKYDFESMEMSTHNCIYVCVAEESIDDNVILNTKVAFIQGYIHTRLTSE